MSNTNANTKKKSNRGGARKGAGRPEGSVNRSTAEIRELIDLHVDLEEIILNLAKLAKGMQYTKYVRIKKGQPLKKVVLTDPPDLKAIELLLAYRFGKPIQQVKDITDRPPTSEDLMTFQRSQMNPIPHDAQTSNDS